MAKKKKNVKFHVKFKLTPDEFCKPPGCGLDEKIKRKILITDPEFNREFRKFLFNYWQCDEFNSNEEFVILSVNNEAEEAEN